MNEGWKRVIAHVDMDAFFASIEQMIHPEYRGKPVIVGADPREGKGRGVVSTASYEARPYGVHSAMPISRAYKLCPDGIYVKPNGKLYSQYSKEVFEILGTFTPLVQAVSVDEAFLDLTGTVHLYGSIEKLGLAIKRRVQEQTGLTASLGISPSKSVSKIASDFDKPDGLTIVSEAEVQAFLDPLAVGRIWGVGKKSLERLSEMGIKTICDLRAFPEDVLQKRLGKWGPHLFRMARGIDTRDVSARDEIKSISHETTFFEDQTDTEWLLSTLLSLSENVSIRLRKHGMRGKTIQLKIRFEDFSTFTRNKTLPGYTNLTDEIYEVGKRLFEKFDHKNQPVRLIGIGVSQLVDDVGMQTSFLEDGSQRKLKVEKVMDQLQAKYGKHALTHARTLDVKHRDRKDKG